MEEVYGLLLPHGGGRPIAVAGCLGARLHVPARTKGGQLYTRRFEQVERAWWQVNPRGEECDFHVRVMREEPRTVELEEEHADSCQHSLSVDRWHDSVECRLCSFRISGEALAYLGFVLRGRYDHKGNALADESQRLRDENRQLLAENARLRRQLERRGAR